MKENVWNKIVLGSTGAALILVAAVNMLIDPFLHYHAPLGGLQYPLKDERYQNDGIMRNYPYNAVITGTSMCQNFLPSEFDDLWGATAIKVCYSGGSYKEIDESVRRALEYQNNVEYVLRSLDSNRLNYPADQNEYEGYPTYLYDQNIFNDVYYLLNKEVIPKTIAVINYTRSGQRTPNWDEYGSWSQYKTFGREEVFRTWQMFEEQEETHELQQEDYDRIRDNVQRNILRTAQENKDVTFYLFFPPYSICYWNTLVRTRQLDAQLAAEKYAVELLLEAENVHVFSFADQIEIISDLDNYSDALHYGEWINSDILKWIHEGKGELTKENCSEWFQRIKEIYLEYDFTNLEQ